MNTTAFRPVVVIPVFDHEHAVGAMVDGVLAVGQACLLVDDGSRPSCAAVLQDLARREGVHLVRLEVNQGKGGAMLAGFREAGRMGARPRNGGKRGQGGTQGRAEGGKGLWAFTSAYAWHSRDRRKF